MNFDFGKNLKRICKQRGTSPTKVVTGLGFTNSKVNMWNNGSLPKAEMLVLLAQALNCSVMDFFKTEEEWENEERKEPELNEDEKDLLRIYQSLSRRASNTFLTHPKVSSSNRSWRATLNTTPKISPSILNEG